MHRPKRAERALGLLDLAAVSGEIASRIDAAWRGGRDNSRDNVGLLASRLANDLQVGGCARWTPELAKRSATHHVASIAPRHDRPHAGLFENLNPTQVKAVRMAHAVVTGDASILSVEELEWLAAEFALEWHDVAASVAAVAARMLAARLAEPTPAVPPTVDFVYAWRGRKPRSPITQGVYRADGSAPLEVVEARRAPVVATLDMPGADALALRSVEGTLFRPVLSPGSSKPIGVGEFLHAAAVGLAWVDNPFCVSQDAWHLAMGPVEYAGPPPVKGLAGNGEAYRQAAEAALAGAGRLAVIDGVVHRSTTPPSLYVRSVDREKRDESGAIEMGRWLDVDLAWEFDDGLHMHRDDRTFGRKDGRLEGRYLEGHKRDAEWSVPLTRGGEMDVLLAEWLGGDPVANGMWAQATHRPGVPCAIVDAAAFPRAPDFALCALGLWDRLYGDPEDHAIRDAVDAARGGRPIDLDGYLPDSFGEKAFVDVPGLLARLVDRVNAALTPSEDEDEVATFRM